ncbi:MAG: O-antigen ligase family protein [Salinivirgaceae bacterium]|nr:O-antigen ligase family protein [Salinivirgaceae bacterium]
MSRKSKAKIKNQGDDTKKKNIIFYLFCALFGFISLVFPIVHYNAALDIVMMPRLYALSLFIVIMGFAMTLWAKKIGVDFGFMRNKIYWLFGAWILFSVISFSLSSNPIEGIFDIIKVVYLPIFVGFTMVVLTLEPDSLSKMTRFLVASALLLAAIAFFQYLKEVILSSETLFDEYGRQTPIIYKVRGFMAHKNLLSIAFVLLLPFSLFGMVRFKRLWKYISIISTILILALIVILQTRAVWVGAMVGVGVSVFVLMFLGSKFGIGKRVQIAIVSIGIVGLLSVIGVIFLSQGTSSNRYVKQLQSIVNPTSKENVHRINIWKTTLDMIQEKPLFGYGPGNWKLHAPEFYNGRFTRENELNWQRPHNDYLWVLAEKGVFGLLIYCGIFAAVFYFLLTVIRRSNLFDERLFALFLIFGLTIYLAASFFDFPYERTYHNTILSIVFATALYLYGRNTKGTTLLMSNKIFILPMLFGGFGVVYAGQCVNQEVYLRTARDHTNYIISQTEMGRSISAKTLQYQWNQVLVNAKLAQKPLKNLDPQANPIYSYEGLAYVNTGQFAKGITVLLKAHEQHPSNINVLNNLGAAYFKLADFDKALFYLEKSYHIFPSLDAVTNLSAVYFKLGRYQEAYDTTMSYPEKERSEQMNNNLIAIKRLLDKEEK